jgi:hypothetical protein
MVKHLPAAVLIAVLAVAVSTASSTRVPLCGMCNTHQPCAGLLICDGTCKKMGVGQGVFCDDVCTFCNSYLRCIDNKCAAPIAKCGEPCGTRNRCEGALRCIDNTCVVGAQQSCKECGTCRPGFKCDKAYKCVLER